MNLIETAKNLVSLNEIVDNSVDFLSDAISGLLGDPVSVGKIIFTLAKSPFFVRDRIFWAKYECFLSGVYASDEDRTAFCAKLNEEGKGQENAVRILDCVDHVDTEQKVKYIINASRSVSANFISLTDYFRICNAIKSNIQEDLQFLSDNIGEKDLDYSQSVQSLLSTGLMYQSVMDGNGGQKYSFTPLADMVDRFAVSFDDVNRYPNPIAGNYGQETPKISIPSLEWHDMVATDEEVKEMLDETFGN